VAAYDVRTVTSRFPGESVDRRTDDPGEPPVDPDADVRDDRAPESGLFAARAAGRRDRQWGVLAAISLGGSLGSVARYLVSEAVPVTAGRFPWATFLINVSGCLAIGLLMVLVLDVWPPNRYARPFVGVGILGGYTTFSTFTVETRNLAAHGAWGLAAAYVLGSLVAGLAAVWGGMTLARLFARLPLRGHRGRGRA
jgi:CrcB protein